MDKIYYVYPLYHRVGNGTHTQGIYRSREDALAALDAATSGPYCQSKDRPDLVDEDAGIIALREVTPTNTWWVSEERLL